MNVPNLASRPTRLKDIPPVLDKEVSVSHPFKYLNAQKNSLYCFKWFKF